MIRIIKIFIVLHFNYVLKTRKYLYVYLKYIKNINIYIKHSFYYLCFIVLKFHAKSKNSKTFQSKLSFIFTFFGENL